MTAPERPRLLGHTSRSMTRRRDRDNEMRLVGETTKICLRTRLDFANVNSMRVALMVLFASFAASCTGGADIEPPDKQCERMREHLIDVKLADAMEVDRGAHAAAMRSALGSDFVSRCVETMSDKQRECVLKAVDSAATNACVAR
jgi:hypothetical protein